VARHGLVARFKGFLEQDQRTCFLLIGQAGSGKTTALSWLALHATPGPAVFLRGVPCNLSTDRVRQHITNALLEPSQLGDGPAGFEQVMAALRTRNTKLVLYVAR
jgi:energy-coupling factor transporter ATP-binding protein EcfA2